jgi:guanylate kinase
VSLPKPGKIIIISSPSGGGKTSICQALLSEERRSDGWAFSVSYTTRKKRPGEVDGQEYFFVNDTEFDRLEAEGFFAESFQVHLYKYGTPRAPLDTVRQNGGVMILDVDVQGAQKLHHEYPDAITIFIEPPSLQALKERLKRRGTETEEQLKVRFENAAEEMELHDRFSYVVINEQLNSAVDEVLGIINQHS